MFIGEPGVALARRLLAVNGPFPWVRNGQCRSEHQDFAHASFGVGLQNHPAQPGVDGQPRESTAEVGDHALLVERTEFLQQLHAVADAAAVRWIQEREVLDVSELQCRHLQDHRGEVGPQYLRFGVARAGFEVLLGVEADAHPRCHPTTPARPLCGRCLRDRFDGQSLYLQSAAVPGDAGVARVDDVADSGHGQ